MMEAKKFVSEDTFDLAPLGLGIRHWVVEKQDYDFQKAGNNSRLKLAASLVEGIRAELRASGSNCDHLRELFYKYMAPNVAKSPA